MNGYKAVGFAHEILAMARRIEELEFENARLRHYEEKYNEEIRNSIDHSEKMMVGLLRVGMKMAEQKTELDKLKGE